MSTENKRLEAAKNAFEWHDKLNEVFVTSDLNCFTTFDKANGHASSLKDRAIDEFHRAAVMSARAANEPADEKVISKSEDAKEAVEFIKTIATAEEIDAYTKGDKRATVKAASEARKAELFAAAEAAKQDDKQGGATTETGEGEAK